MARKYEESTLLSLDIIAREVRRIVDGVTGVWFREPQNEDVICLQIERGHDGVAG